MKKLIIFDMDGVLLDSETLYMNMNQKFFRELGAEISLEEHQTFVGISATTMWSYIREKFSLRQTVGELKEQEKELKYRLLLESELIATEGIPEFLASLRENGCIITIASSGLRKNIELILGKLGIGDYFDHIVSGEEVLRGKPEPDIFLKVAEHYGKKPEECIVIEDSTNGVRAAKSAGMFCIGFFNPGSGKQDLSEADLIIDSFRDPALYGIIGLQDNPVKDKSL